MYDIRGLIRDTSEERSARYSLPVARHSRLGEEPTHLHMDGKTRLIRYYRWEYYSHVINSPSASPPSVIYLSTGQLVGTREQTGTR